MRLAEVTLHNFRGYKSATTVQIDRNLTGITGRNDAGKSTILEALDIFFEGGEISIDQDDISVGTDSREITITCVFDDLPENLVIDENTSTTLAAEYLLDRTGRLTITKRYRGATLKPAVFVRANHPTASGAGDLHLLKLQDLKKRAADLKVDASQVTDGRACSAWRQAIWNSVQELDLQEVELEIGRFSTESKGIQERLFAYLPLFALFRSDRESRDNDPVAKNPMQEAVKQAQAELKDEIEALQAKIQQRVIERANLTIEKLREFDPSLADKLMPRFKSPPKWTFDFNLDGDDSIPINKRGSGVRRLILLNFFRAEAEQRVRAKNAPAVIYAIEEPETSQHPANQEMLVRALLQLSSREQCQVILTTHVPGLAGLLPTEGLRFVEKTEAGPVVRESNETVLETISASLGVLADQGVTGAKALLLVEGPSDVVFVRHTAMVLKDGGVLPATLEDKGILPISIGGCGNLKHWVTKKLADQFGIPWAILLDSDKGTPEEGNNLKAIERHVPPGTKAFLTRKREPENYIPREIVEPHVKNGELPEYGPTCDAKQIIGLATEKRPADVLEIFWTKLDFDAIRTSENYLDERNLQRFEFSEMLIDVLGIVDA